MAAPNISGAINLDNGSAEHSASAYPGAVNYTSRIQSGSGFRGGTLTNSTALEAGWNYGVDNAIDCSIDGGMFAVTSGRSSASSGFTSAGYPSGAKLLLNTEDNSGVYTQGSNYRECLLFSNGSPASIRPAISAASDLGEILIDPTYTHLNVDVGEVNLDRVRRTSILLLKTTSSNNAGIETNRIYYIPAVSAVGGEVGDPGTFHLIRTYLRNLFGNGTTPIAVFVSPAPADSVFQFGPSITIGDGVSKTVFVDRAFTVFFPTGRTSTQAITGRLCDIQVSDDYPIFRIKPSPTDTIVLSGNISRSNGFRFIIDTFSGTPTIDLTLILIRASQVILRAGVVFSGSLIECGEATPNGATVGNLAIDDSTGLSGILLTPAATVESGRIVGCVAGCRIAAAGDFSACSIRFEDNQVSDVLISSGVTEGNTVNIDISGFIYPAGSTTPHLIQVDDIAGTINLTVGAGVASGDVTSAGAVVNIISPISEIVLLGLPNVANVRLLVRNLAASTQAFYTVTGGTVSIPTNPTSTYEVRADAPGYLASDFVELPGNTPQFRFNLINRRDIYDAGVTRFDRIILDPATFAISIADGPPLTPEDVFRTLEDYLVIESAGVVAGLLYTAHPIPVTIPGRFILRFVFDTIANALNPARLKPHPDNVSDPELLFEIELERAEDFDLDPTYALLDYSDAPAGRIIRVRSQIAIASVSVSGGLSTADRAVIDGIAAQTARVDGLIEPRTPGAGDRLKAAALEESPAVGVGGGLGPDDIARLARIENQLIADEVKGRDRYQRLLPGTQTVILDKDVTFNREEGFTLLEHQEPAP